VPVNAFTKDHVANGSAHFKVSRHKSDTTSPSTISKRAQSAWAPPTAKSQRGSLQSGHYNAIWLLRPSRPISSYSDRPPTQPTSLNTADVLTMFLQLHATAEAAISAILVRFLSRYDRSTPNIKDPFLWPSIGQASNHPSASY
jgi:hypothetical protein